MQQNQAAPEKGTWERAWEGLGEQTVAVTKWLGMNIASPGIDFVQGMSRKVWESLPSREAAYDFLWRTGEFFASVPKSIADVVMNLVQRIGSDIDSETAQALVDQMQWIAAFEADDIFSAAQTDNSPQGRLGPRELLLNESQETRKALYRDFVMKMFYNEVRTDNEFQSLFGDKGEHRDTMITNKNHILDASKLLLGEKDPTNDNSLAEKLAKREIEERYFSNDRIQAGDGTLPLENILRTYKAGLKADYQKLRLYHPDGLTASQLQSPDLLYAVLPPSLMRGALMMGVLQQSDLENLRRRYEHAEGRLNESTIVIGRNLDLAYMRKQAESVEKVWAGMNGIEKLILIAGAIAAAVKWKGAAIGVAAAYFGRKFFFNDQSPLNTFVDLARSGVSKVKSLGEGFLGKVGMEPELAPREYGDIMLSFMHENVREDLIQGAEGFGLVAKAPLSALAQSIDVDESGGSGVLDITKNGSSWNRDSALYGVIKEQIDRKKIDRRRIETFFLRGERAEQNRTDVADALTHVFYMIAASEPENHDRMLTVEREADHILAGEGYDEIVDPTARKYYHDLVITGQKLARSGKYAGKSLVQLISEMRGVRGRGVVPSSPEIQEDVILPPTPVLAPEPVLAPGVVLPPTVLAPPGTLLKSGSVLPSGAVLPPAFIDSDDVLPPAIIHSSASVYSSVVIPPGTILPAGTVITKGSLIPPARVREALNIASDAVVAPNILLPPRTILPSGSILKPGSKLPPAVLPPGTVLDAPVIDQGAGAARDVVIPPGTVLTGGSVLPSGAFIPPSECLRPTVIAPDVIPPRGMMLVPGTIIPNGAILPDGIMFPPEEVSSDVTLPDPVVDPGVVLPNGFTPRPGMVLPAGTVLPPGTYVPPSRRT